MEFDSTQQTAIASCCDISKRIVGVTGGAGTGKTSILKEVYRLLVEAGYSVALAAPTGKAAKRIQELTSVPAVTLHRLLKYTHPGERDPKTGKPYGFSFPQHDQATPIPFDIIIADEYAMVNQEVHRNLLNAIKPGGCIRVFGDVNQLPPIEKTDALIPSPFTDLLTRFPSTTLTTIHRQGAGSGIVSNGAKINRGMAPIKTDDFSIIFTDEPVARLEKILREAQVSFADTNNQILTPSNISWVGTHKLNALIQTIYRTESDGWLKLERHTWDQKHPIRVRKGDKVICGQNDYNLEIFNGEGGTVIETTDFGEIVIDLGDREIVFPPTMSYTDKQGNVRDYNPQRDLYLAYAITTHKAQGSEYDNVIYVLNKSTAFIQLRANFYTAVTRARTKVCVITDMRSMSISVSRKTPLPKKMKQEIKE